MAANVIPLTYDVKIEKNKSKHSPWSINSVWVITLGETVCVGAVIKLAQKGRNFESLAVCFGINTESTSHLFKSKGESQYQVVSWS